MSYLEMLGLWTWFGTVVALLWWSQDEPPIWQWSHAWMRVLGIAMVAPAMFLFHLAMSIWCFGHFVRCTAEGVDFHEDRTFQP